jgi:thermostable 8-oxoguanine DNA glycosylase
VIKVFSGLLIVFVIAFTFGCSGGQLSIGGSDGIASILREALGGNSNTSYKSRNRQREYRKNQFSRMSLWSLRQTLYKVNEKIANTEAIITAYRNGRNHIRIRGISRKLTSTFMRNVRNQQTDLRWIQREIRREIKNRERPIRRRPY